MRTIIKGWKMNNTYLSFGRGSGKSYKQAKLMREYLEDMKKSKIEQQAINKILEFKQRHGHMPTIICLDKKDKYDLLESSIIHKSKYNRFIMGVVIKEHNSVEILVK